MGAAIECILFKNKGENVNFSEVNSFLDIVAKDIDGKDILMKDIMRNKKCVMVVNVASNCVFSKSNYTDMVQLHNKYKDHGFEILAFPCN